MLSLISHKIHFRLQLATWQSGDRQTRGSDSGLSLSGPAN